MSLVATYSPHVVGITESWLHSNVYDSEFTPPGFIAIRNDRAHGIGGGVALLIRSDIRFSVLPSPPEIESLWCKIYLNNQCIVVSVIYRPPGSSLDVLHAISDFMCDINIASSRLICMGDFNAPDIDWPSLTVTGRDAAICHELINISLSFGLTQVVSCATRFNSILDLVFLSTDLADNNFSCEVIDGLSDHKDVLLSLCCPTSKSPYTFTSFSDFTRADDNSITDILANHFDTFCALSDRQDIDYLVNYFEDLVKSCVRRFVPLNTKKSNTNLPWITRDILHLSRRVRRLRRSGRTHDPVSLDKFQKAKSELNSEMRTTKDFFFRVQLPGRLSTNPRKFWYSILPHDASPFFRIDNDVISDPSAISKAFNNYFQSVFVSDNNSIPSLRGITRSEPISDIQTTSEGILNLILKLDVKKCTGPDGIHNAFLVRYSIWSSRYLTIIFNKSLSSGTVPSSWKIAKVLPLYKSGNKQSLLNYRPISLTYFSIMQDVRTYHS